MYNTMYIIGLLWVLGRINFLAHATSQKAEDAKPGGRLDRESVALADQIADIASMEGSGVAF